MKEILPVIERFESKQNISPQSMIRVRRAFSGFPPFVIEEIQNEQFPKVPIALQQLANNCFEDILQEFSEYYETKSVPTQQRGQGRTEKGKWSSLNLFVNGQKVTKTIQSFPKTVDFLNKAGASTGPGLCCFSILESNTKVRPHHGPHNFRIRCQLGLVVPDRCFISVDGKVGKWTRGEILMLDDSYLHFSENTSDTARAILLFDIWNPDLTKEEIDCIKYVMREIEAGKSRLKYAKQQA